MHTLDTKIHKQVCYLSLQQEKRAGKRHDKTDKGKDGEAGWVDDEVGRVCVYVCVCMV